MLIDCRRIATVLRTRRFLLAGNALQAARRCPATMIPLLLQMLEEAANDPAAAIASGTAGHRYALVLLAEFREPRAAAAVRRLTRLPEPTFRELLGESGTTQFHRILGSLCLEDTSLLQAIIADPGSALPARVSAVRAFGVLFNDHSRAPWDLIDEVGQLLRRGPDDGPSPIWGELADMLTMLSGAEYMPDVLAAFERGLVIVEDPEDRRRDAEYLADHPHWPPDFNNLGEYGFPIDDAYEHMSAEWPCFRGPFAPGDEASDPPDYPGKVELAVFLGLLPRERRPLRFEIRQLDPNEPLPEVFGDKRTPAELQSSLKIGRNAPCPCGSGRKYKKCCA